jgi:hypothetical protein
VHDSLGAQATVFVTKSLTNLIQQLCGAQHSWGSGFHGCFFTVFKYRLHAVGQSCKALTVFFSSQFIDRKPIYGLRLFATSITLGVTKNLGEAYAG